MEHLRDQWRKTASSGTYWRVHSKSRPFLISDAFSVPMSSFGDRDRTASGLDMRIVDLPPVTMYAAVEGGKVIGALSVLQDDYISLVYVAPEHRHRGIATKLLEFARSKRPVFHSESRTQAGGGWSRAMGDDSRFEPSDPSMAEGDGQDMLRYLQGKTSMRTTAALREGMETQFGEYRLVYTTEDQGESKPRHVVTAYLDGKKVGYLMWYGKTGEVSQILVAVEHRRQGLGTAMWKFAQDAPKAPKHSPQRTFDGEAWARSLNEKLPRLFMGGPRPRRVHASLPGGVYWRMHPTGRHFDVADAKSTDFGPAPETRTGYSCVANPWHLYVYSEVMGWFDFRGGRSVTSESDLVAFTGHEMSRRGADGEFLVKPDSLVQRLSWGEFVGELTSTPFGEFWAPRSKHLRSWEEFANDRPPGVWIGSSPRAVLTKAVLARFAPDKLAREQEWVK